MVSFERFILDNGLRVLVHEDPHSPMACVNILYDVGARDEQPDKTGFAHLFEHLMFSGSVHIPSFDQALQRVGGENNAFTSNDITNYYITLPAKNLETAFWLESDRMLSLAFNEQGLEVQRSVVIEEFKQRYLNQPYGDVWLKLRPMAYKEHPYRWATIGKEIKHIEEATLADVKSFFAKHYLPNNAIMVVTGDVNTADVKALVEKWFADIPSGEKPVRNLPVEPLQQEARKEDVFGDVPVDSLYMAFHTVDRMDNDYQTADLLSDILSRGSSSRLYRSLVKDKHVFSEINCYILGSIDSNLLLVEGKPSEGVSLEVAELAVWNELNGIKDELVTDYELNKVKNKIESTLVFSELSILDKAMNLAFYELLGDANNYNSEVQKYNKITAADIQRVARDIFRKENASVLFYHAQKSA
ncbi:insulinase family protein [Sphingobacterium sp. DK4209]|uniref:Insulinase family protein n=1 Tax=Sphingobacterium zhuxiongii TaxID=2662364 RepID=A0A5Q0QBA7_9SPHI|nr:MULTISPECIES: pitrilysin family protein [unclassified Sphingobacterium]MVZ66582.1 insulinase family protein [Sphingobacterium sp. DK4209]QGA26766.1 insulinase family protein [Sphingobacterium sp. dk4302]